jgi:hypothetical protein
MLADLGLGIRQLVEKSFSSARLEEVGKTVT